MATWVVAGCTISPPIVALCLRAGWSLAVVNDQYLFHKNAEDQYVGCCTSGLMTDTSEFAICQAYFDFSRLESEEEKLERKNFIKS